MRRRGIALAADLAAVVVRIAFLRILLAVDAVAADLVAPAILTLVDHASASAVR